MKIDTKFDENIPFEPRNPDHADRKKNRPTSRHTDRQNEKQTDIQTHRQTHRQTDRPTVGAQTEILKSVGSLSNSLCYASQENWKSGGGKSILMEKRGWAAERKSQAEEEKRILYSDGKKVLTLLLPRTVSQRGVSEAKLFNMLHWRKARDKLRTDVVAF